jgi:serine/threonine protein kinase
MTVAGVLPASAHGLPSVEEANSQAKAGTTRGMAAKPPPRKGLSVTLHAPGFTKMAVLIMESADLGNGYDESLAERLARGVVPVPYALLCATDIASTLRDLHGKGLAHGDVTPESIRLGKSGARLQPRGARCGSTDVRSDVVAFGAVLYEMMAGTKPPAGVNFVFKPVTAALDLDDVRRDAIRLAGRCLGGVSEIRPVLIELRILGILSRRIQAAPRRIPVLRKPATLAVMPPRPPRVLEMPAAGAEPDLPRTELKRPAIAGPRLQIAPEPDVPQAEPAFQPARDVPQPAQGTALCPMCSGNAPFVRPRSIIDRLLSKISLMRQCEICGYRFIVMRFRRNHPPA